MTKIEISIPYLLDRDGSDDLDADKTCLVIFQEIYNICSGIVHKIHMMVRRVFYIFVCIGKHGKLLIYSWNIRVII